MGDINTNDLSVVFGTGPLGLSVMRELIKGGGKVRMVNRSGSAQLPSEVEVVKGDVTNSESVQSLARDAGVVYLCAQPKYTEWPEKFPPIMRGAIDGVARTGAKLIFGDNLYMYGPVDGPLHEDLPYAATGRKGRARALIANMLMQAHEGGKVRAAIGRSSDFYGSYVFDSAAGERVFASALAGKPAGVIGDPDTLHTYMYIDDFGRGLVTLGRHEEALGKVWHLPSAPTVTTRRFVEMVYGEVGLPPKMRVAPPLVISAMGLFMPVMREVKEMLYEFDKPFVVDASRFERAFGDQVQVTPHEEGIKRTVAWYKEHKG